LAQVVYAHSTSIIKRETIKMMKLLLFALVVSSSALLIPKKKGPGGRNLHQKKVEATTTREDKAFCKSASEIGSGSWVSLKEDEYAKAPEGSGCNPQKMMWEPNTCKLPYHSNETPMKKKGRVVFVGDSISDTSARSFAWFYDGLSAKEHNACKYEKEDLQKKVKLQLMKGGFNAATIATTTEYLEEQGFRKNHHWWGCNTSVSYVPTDTPPPQGAVQAFMFALKNFGSKPLGPEDTIVLNWGQWAQTNGLDKSEAQWVPSMKVLMKEYAKWQEKKEAPKLIWREVSPNHWGANTFTFNKKDFEATQTSKGCSPAGGPKMMQHQMNNKNQFPLRNTKLFQNAVKEAGLKIDGVNIDVLPIWRGTAERYEDHQPITKYQISTGQSIDCTHFCTHGNVNRFWNSALVATISGMQEKNV